MHSSRVYRVYSKRGGLSMAWVACDKSGEWIFEEKPFKDIEFGYWFERDSTDDISLPHGSIKKLIGRELTFKDEPVELKEE